jgi:hypothetical protein
MIKPKLLITAIVVLLFFAKASAQDTAHYDLGRIQLKKDFNQGITVKGEDLEKMPFTNLAEAINVWFYGSYTNITNLVYVVDGNLVNDANAYSIYDIDEVTLLQSALTKIAGTSQQQQLVLIKTKRSKTKGSGVTAAGQVNISSLYTNNIPTTPFYNNGVTEYPNTYQTGIKSTTTVYQQYFVSAYQNTGNMQYGASVDYLTDGLPQIKEPSASYSQSIDRLRLNGYFDAKLGRSALDVTASYNPQTGKDDSKSSFSYGNYNNTVKQSDHLFNGSIKLTTPIIPGLVNVIHADYNNYRGDDNGTGISTSTFSSSVENILTKNTNYSHTIVAYDNLDYDFKFNDWGLEPAVNISFRSFLDSTYASTYSYYKDQAGSVATSAGWQREKDHRFLLTPSINLYYKSYFNIQGGLLYNIVPPVYLKPAHKLFPFISISADLMRLINPVSTVTIKGYITYAINPFLPDNFSQLPDFNNTTILQPVDAYTNTVVLQPVAGNSGTYFANYNAYLNNAKTYNTFTAGLTVSPSEAGLTFSYFFERNSYVSFMEVIVPAFLNTQNEYFLTNTNSILHRFSVDYTLNKSFFDWHTGINATMIKQSYLLFGTNIATGNNQWTGGWVNRLNYRDFFAGANLLYQSGEKVYAIENGKLVTSTINSFSLQSLYAGYHLKIKGLKAPEVFANAKNIFQNKKEDITDDRKYIGLGFKLSL